MSKLILFIILPKSMLRSAENKQKLSKVQSKRDAKPQSGLTQGKERQGKLGVVVHTFNTCTGAAEAGRSL